MVAELPKNSINWHVDSAIRDFVNLGQTEAALLVTGPWGVGKTYLVRQLLERIAHDESKPPLFVSLFGASSAAEISERIFVARHPFLASRGAVLGRKLAAAFLRGALRLDFGEPGGSVWSQNVDLASLLDASAERKSELHQRILVLDDVERCGIEPAQLWGLINALILEDQAKVVLVASESALKRRDADKESGYLVVKEKNIAATVRVRPDLPAAMDSMLRASGWESPESEKVRGCLEKAFIQSGVENLRVLRSCITLATRVLHHLSGGELKVSTVAPSVFRQTVALCAPVLQGRVSAGTLRRFTRYATPIEFETEPEDDAGRSFRAEFGALKETVEGSDLGLHEPWPSVTWWADLVEHGVLDTDALVVAAAEQFASPKTRPAWKQLVRVDELDDEEFVLLLDQTFEEMGRGSYREDPSVLLHVVSVHLWACESEISEHSQQDVVSVASREIRELGAADFARMLGRRRDVDRALRGSHGFVYADRENESYKIVEARLRKRFDRIRNEELDRFASGVLEALRANEDAKVVQMLEEGPPSPCAERDAFVTLVEPSAFAAALVSCDQWFEVLLALRPRVRSGGDSAAEWLARVSSAVQHAPSGLRRNLLLSQLRELQR